MSDVLLHQFFSEPLNHHSWYKSTSGSLLCLLFFSLKMLQKKLSGSSRMRHMWNLCSKLQSILVTSHILLLVHSNSYIFSYPLICVLAVYHRKCSRSKYILHHSLKQITANSGRIQGGDMLSLHIFVLPAISIIWPFWVICTNGDMSDARRDKGMWVQGTGH